MASSSNQPTNRKIVLRERRDGPPLASQFAVEEETAREPNDGEVLIATDTVSVDAFIRTTLNDFEGHHGVTPIGGTITALGVGRVVESKTPAFSIGDAVTGPTLAQTYATMPGEAFQKIDDSKVPMSAYLGILGLTTGVTAYFGMRHVGQAKKGETVVVSGAAGAVGSIAAQIAKLDGAKVIGIAGGPHKVRYLTETIGLDAGIDYKGEDIAARLRELAPDGVDVFFDNVGGEQLDIVLDQIRDRARVAICGAISQYGHHQDVRGPKLYLRLAERYARMEGFTVMHFMEHFAEAYAQLTEWMEAGVLKLPEHVENGIDAFPHALETMFKGGHMGKLIVKI